MHIKNKCGFQGLPNPSNSTPVKYYYNNNFQYISTLRHPWIKSYCVPKKACPVILQGVFADNRQYFAIFVRFYVRYMLLNIIKAFCVGICASVPLGPIAIMVVQKSLSKGVRSGFMTGAGASTADTIYAIVALFFLAIAQELLNRYSAEILIGGGIVVSVIGILLAVSNPFRKVGQIDKVDEISSKDYFQGLLMALTNPGAIAIMFGLFASFGLDLSGYAFWQTALVIISLSVGSLLYWFGVSYSLSRFRKKFKMNTLILINRIAGWIIAAIGILFFAYGLYELMF